MHICDCTKNDIDLVSRYAFKKNTDSQCTSFLSTKYENVVSEITESLGEKSLQAMVIEKSNCIGYINVVMNDEYIPGDVIGPFFENESIAKELIDYAKNKIDKDIVLKFNVDFRNPLCNILNEIGAIKKAENYKLELDKNDYSKRSNGKGKIQQHEKKIDSHVKDLYYRAFEDTYMEFYSLLNYENNNANLVDCIDNNEFIGFAYYQKRGYIDFIAIESYMRKKGYGRNILSAIIDDIFKNESIINISMNVDLDNEIALDLYKSLGFIVKEKYISFHIH